MNWLFFAEQIVASRGSLTFRRDYRLETSREELIKLEVVNLGG